MNAKDIKFLVYHDAMEYFTSHTTLEEAQDEMELDDEIFMIHGITKGVHEYSFKVKEVIE